MRERMEYRAAYVLGIVAQIMGYGSDYAVIFLLLRRFQTLNGWTWPQVAFLYSLDLFSYAIGASVAFPMLELEQMVADGSFDVVLVRPLDPLLHLMARKYNVGYAAHIILSGAFLVWAVGRLGLALTPLHLLYLTLAIAGASCLQAAMLILLGSLAFLIVRSGVLMGLYYTLKGFVSYPLTLYGVGIQWLLTLVVPLAFINFYPAALLLDKGGAVLPVAAGWLAPLVGPALLALAYRVFAGGVARYQGAGG
jgi:ABC-2 type transport system permease protein